jgi:PIN domain nuclease of toxin-antitoxin system
MRLLLDTHAFLWFIDGNSKLNTHVRDLIGEIGNERLLSTASLWEMAIKKSLGKLTLPLPFTKLVAEHVYGNAMALLWIHPQHLDRLRTLPFYHKDPFDRLLIAQSLSENIPILSRDEVFDEYAVQRMWD